MVRLFTQETVEVGDEVVGVLDVGQWPQSGIRLREPFWRRAATALVWGIGNTGPEVPQTRCVGIF
jgi:hypothetical protein